MPEENQKHLKSKNRTRIIILILVILAILALISSLFILVRDYRVLHRAGLLRPEGRQPGQIFQHMKPDYEKRRLEESDKIQGWMTFGFINRVFGLPQDYLKDNLKITSGRYPNFSISSWAKESKQDAAKLTSEISNLVKNYPSQTPSASPFQSSSPSASPAANSLNSSREI